MMMMWSTPDWLTVFWIAFHPSSQFSYYDRPAETFGWNQVYNVATAFGQVWPTAWPLLLGDNVPTTPYWHTHTPRERSDNKQKPYCSNKYISKQNQRIFPAPQKLAKCVSSFAARFPHNHYHIIANSFFSLCRVHVPWTFRLWNGWVWLCIEKLNWKVVRLLKN